MEIQKKEVVNIIDVDFIPFYVCHNKKDAEKIKTLEDCIAQCDDFIKNINNKTGADHYIGFLTKGKCFRYQVNPDYKANRKYDKLPDFLQEVKQHLIDKHNCTFQEGYEADDLIVSYKAQNTQYECIIVSPDKDLLLLEGRHLNPREMAWVNSTENAAEFNFWKSMIKGDSADNIKGIPGKGEAYYNTIAVEAYSDKPVKLSTVVFEAYIRILGEYEGIKEFTKNYLSLKLVDKVELREVKLNKIDKEVSEQKE